MKKIITILVILSLISIFYSISVVAVCVGSGVSGNVSLGSIVGPAKGVCSASDKSDTAHIVWKNSTGDILFNQTLTIPSSQPFDIFSQIVVNSSMTPQENLYVEMYDEFVLFSNQTFNTSSAGGVTTLDITDCSVTKSIFQNRRIGTVCTIKNEGDPVTFARVCGHVDDVDDIITIGNLRGGCVDTDGEGKAHLSTICDDTWCFADQTFKFELLASCPLNTTTKGDREICVKNSKSMSFATGSQANTFTIKPTSDIIIVKKWITEFSIPGVYLKNEHGAKTRIQNNPAFISPINISWGDFNNTKKRNATQNGEGFVTANELSSLCILFNNTDEIEREVTIQDLTFDDDNLQQLAHAHNPDTGEELKGDIATFLVKPSSSDGLQEKCTSPFLMDDTVIGGIDWDANFNIRITDFDQLVQGESDEFAYFSRFEGLDFVPIIDIRNISTSASIKKVDACTEIDVILTYNFYGDVEDIFDVDYCFIENGTGHLEGCKTVQFKPESGTNNTINRSIEIPFVQTTSIYKVDIEVKNEEGEHVGFANIQPQNELNITADLSDTCRFQVTDDQFLQARQARALEGINSSAGTFDFAINVPDTSSSTVLLSGGGLTGDGRILNRDVTVKCSVDGFAFTLKQFETFATDTFSFTQIMDVPEDTRTYTMRCTVIDNFFGEDAVQATDNFRRVSAPAIGGGGGGSSINPLLQLRCDDIAQERQQCYSYNEVSRFCEVGCSGGNLCTPDFKCVDSSQIGLFSPPTIPEKIKEASLKFIDFVQTNLLFSLLSGAVLSGLFFGAFYSKEQKQELFNKWVYRKKEKGDEDG